MIQLNEDGLNPSEANIIKKIIEKLCLPEHGCDYTISHYQNRFLIECNNEESKTSFLIDQLMRHNEKIYTKLFPLKNASILDCTAGLGRDGILLSELGYNVTMIEKNPLLILLIRNYLSRNAHIKARLLYGDALTYTHIAEKEFDYIYIDFMFEKKNNSKPSKYDLFLRSINYNENNKSGFINKMKNYCKKRIVVKEPMKSRSEINDHDYEIKTNLIKYKIFNGKLVK